LLAACLTGMDADKLRIAQRLDAFGVHYIEGGWPGSNEKDIELNAAPATRRHMRDFLGAIDQHGRPVADIEEGHISTASCILANVAMEIGRPIVYDPQKRVAVDDDDATSRLRRAYRGPWIHP